MILITEHRFGTKHDVTPFIKPADMHILVIVLPFGYNLVHLHTVSHLTVWTFEIAPC